MSIGGMPSRPWGSSLAIRSCPTGPPQAPALRCVFDDLWTHRRHLAACYHQPVDHVARRLEDALELADLAERMVRARLQREQPNLRGDALEARVRAWLRSRPCAVDGDADGRPVDLEQPT